MSNNWKLRRSSQGEYTIYNQTISIPFLWVFFFNVVMLCGLATCTDYVLNVELWNHLRASVLFSVAQRRGLRESEIPASRGLLYMGAIRLVLRNYLSSLFRYYSSYTYHWHWLPFYLFRVGFAQALGSLPKFLLSNRLKMVSFLVSPSRPKTWVKSNGLFWA